MYGRHPVLEVLRAGRRAVQRLLVTGAAWKSLEAEVARAGGAKLPVEVVEADRLERRSASGDHQGIVAIVEPYPYLTFEELIDSEPRHVLFLDQLSDPHNIGAIARVAEAAGVDGMVVPRHRSAHVTPAVCKASAGAIEHVRLAVCTNLADAIGAAQRAGMWVYGAAGDGARAYHEVDVSGRIGWVLGSEGTGLRPRVRAACDEIVSVPMRGRVESLNVSTVAALLAFEVVRHEGDE